MQKKQMKIQAKEFNYQGLDQQNKIPLVQQQIMYNQMQLMNHQIQNQQNYNYLYFQNQTNQQMIYFNQLNKNQNKPKQNKQKEKKKAKQELQKQLGEWNAPVSKIEEIKEKNKQPKQEQQQKQTTDIFKKLGLIRIGQEIYKFKKKNNIVVDQKKVKYHAIGVSEQLVIKLKKKDSKLKKCLQKYKQFKEDIFKKHVYRTQNHQQKTLSDLEYTTVEEISEDEQPQNQQKIEKKKTFAEDFIINEDQKEELDKDVFSQENIKIQALQQNLRYHWGNDQTLINQYYNQMNVRSWVDHKLDPQLDDLIMKLINKLSYSQIIKKLQQPLKYKKRIIAGFNEVQRSLETNLKEKQSKCLIFAINIPENPLKGGTDELVLNQIKLAKQKSIPVIHACSRKKIGIAFTGKTGPKIAVISIINYQGFEQLVQDIKDWMKSNNQNIF